MWTTRIYSVAICQVGKDGLQEAKTKGFRNFWEELKGDRLDLVLLLFLYTLQVDLFFPVCFISQIPLAWPQRQFDDVHIFNAGSANRACRSHSSTDV